MATLTALLLLAAQETDAADLVRDAARSQQRAAATAFAMNANGYAQSGTWEGLTVRTITHFAGTPELWANGNRVAVEWGTPPRWQAVDRLGSSIQGMDLVHQYEVALLARVPSEIVQMWMGATQRMAETPQEDFNGTPCHVIDATQTDRGIRAEVGGILNRAYTRNFAPVAANAVDFANSHSTYRAWIAVDGGALKKLEWTLDITVQAARAPQGMPFDPQSYFDHHYVIEFRDPPENPRVDMPGGARQAVGG